MTKSPEAAKKDVIYVDIEDDITAIIAKVKDSSAPIVALVPPKRIGVLQSMVNLKLLQRTAHTAKKRLVMITSDPALTALAAGVSMPIAKNLQSRPEVPEITAIQTDDGDVINGEELPLAMHTGATLSSKTTEDSPASSSDTPAALSAASKAPNKTTAKSRVPNFDKFRNKMALIIGGVTLLVVLLVWAFFFAPRATVTITARTTSYDVDKSLVAVAGASLDAGKGTLPVIIKEIKKTASSDFTATGKKDVGETASGTVKFSTSNIDSLGTVIPAGTELTSASGLVFTTDSSVTITLQNYRGATTAVTAAERGSKYNGASGAVSGAPSGISAAFADASTGGTDKTVTVVSEQDAASARDKLAGSDAASIKSDLKKQFNSDIVVVDESFQTRAGDPIVSPAVGEEASAGKVTLETTYTMMGLQRSDLKSIVDADIKRQIQGIPNQKIYDNGLDKLRFSKVTPIEGGYQAMVESTGYVGPQIDSNKLAREIVGKREGEIQAHVKTLEGIEAVDVNFSPFWVSTAPAADKIVIKFQIKDAN